MGPRAGLNGRGKSRPHRDSFVFSRTPVLLHPYLVLVFTVLQFAFCQTHNPSHLDRFTPGNDTVPITNDGHSIPGPPTPQRVAIPTELPWLPGKL